MHWFSRKDLKIKVPRHVEHGLRPRSMRGKLGQSWWSQKFVSLIEDDPKKSHLEAARRYVRKGQIMKLNVNPGEIAAKVQGTQDQPYDTRVCLPAVDDDTWRRLIQRLVARSEYMACLLADIVPESLPELFEKAGVPLIPDDVEHVSWTCTCSEETIPCKHVAAVFYLVADRMDDDPFMLLRWRGRGRQEILGALRESWGADPELGTSEDSEEDVLTEADIPRFFSLPPDFDQLPYPPPSDQPDVIRRLGFPPFFPPSDRTVQQTLAGLYTDND